MATVAADSDGEVPVINGIGGDTPMELSKSNDANLGRVSARPFSLNLTPGPPILHPTVTTWQWLFSASDMAHAPSIVHTGMSMEQEKFYRWKGIQLIYRIGEYMRIGNHVLSTASVYFHRFYMRKAFCKDVRERIHDTFTFQEMAPTCLFLACKVEETTRKIPVIVEATMAVLDRSPQGMEMAESRSYKPDFQSREYSRWKDLILLYEERLLEMLCFDLIIDQPHAIAIKACKQLDTSRDMAQLTAVLLNALSYGAVSVFYDAATIAAGAFQKACNLVEVDPSSFTEKIHTTESWFDAFDVDPEEVQDVMVDIEEQLIYHDEKMRQSRPFNLATPLANTTTPNTPHQMEVDTPTKVASTVHQKHTHFATQESDIETKQEEGQHHSTIENNLPDTQYRNGQEDGSNGNDSSAIERENRTEVSRPMSRHGSKGASIGPPPPLGVPDSSVEEGREESSTVTEVEAAMKVHQEQIKQEQIEHKGTLREDQMEEVQRDKFDAEEGQAEDSQAEEGEIESEEEGAL